MDLSQLSYNANLQQETAIEFEHHSIWRSIPTANPTKKIYYPDSLDENEQALAEYLAEETSGIDHSQRKEERWYQYGDNEKTEFCFHAVNIPSSRFTNGSFPVWYGADSQECSEAEVIHHLCIEAKKELEHTKSENVIRFERAFCKSHIKCDRALDIRKYAQIGHAGICENGPPYPFCNDLGYEAYNSDFKCILTLSRRLNDSECVAVFKKDAILGSVVKAFWFVEIRKNGEIWINGCEKVKYENGYLTVSV